MSKIDPTKLFTTGLEIASLAQMEQDALLLEKELFVVSLFRLEIVSEK